MSIIVRYKRSLEKEINEEFYMIIYSTLLITIVTLLIISSIGIIKVSNKVINQFIEDKKISKIISFFSVLVFILGFIIDFINTLIVSIHLIIIIFITKLLFKIIERISKKKIKKYLYILFGTIISIIILIYGYNSAYNVVETDYRISTPKDIGVNRFRIVQVSDSHIGATMDGKKFTQYMEEINKLEPDIVVVTGDFVDDSTKYEDMVEASIGLGMLKTKYGVYFSYGNHDKGYYKRSYNDSDIRRELLKNNVKILEDEVVEITNKVILIGRQDSQVKNRISAQNLTSNLDKEKYMIMLDHKPDDYKNEAESNVDLVLSGHTHGGQLVPIGQISLLLGINDRIYGIEKRNNTTFIVNSGISDWEIKFKTGAISEYVVIDVEK